MRPRKRSRPPTSRRRRRVSASAPKQDRQSAPLLRTNASPTKRVGVAAGTRARFRADKPRRGAGGTSGPQDVTPQEQALPAAEDDTDSRLLQGVSDLAHGDWYASGALGSIALAARQPKLWKAIAGGVVASIPVSNMLGRASQYWSTPEAQEALSTLYQGPTGGFTP